MILQSIFLFLALFPLAAATANPIFEGADPHAAMFDGTVWIYPTHSEGGKNFWAYKQMPRKTWEKVGPLLDLKDVPWLAAENQETMGPWAPCIVKSGAGYYFYYSVGPQRPGHPSRIGVASGDSPVGPFKDAGKVLVTGGGGFEAIDPMVFQDPVSRKYFLYCGGSAGATLKVFELNQDLLTVKKEIEVENPPNFTEGAFMHQHGGLYHLTYSHGNFRDASYSVHHATSKSPTGPWDYRGVILKSDELHKGPGHHSILQISGVENWQIVYHRWDHQHGDGPYSGKRVIAIDRLIHNRDGSIQPVIMTD